MNIESFSFFQPGMIYFGVGSSLETGSRLKDLGLARVLLISDRGLEAAGLVKKLEDVLLEADISYATFLDVEVNPSIETVNQALELYKENNSHGVLCLGGGSPIDTAKAVSILISNGGSIQDFEGPHKVRGPVVPVVAIPTTAGTGSEVTPFTVITNRQTNCKFSIFSYETIPRMAILDPVLITTLPPLLAASTSMDALTHAIEAYISLVASPFSDAMAEKSMELILDNIRCFVANRADLEAASGVLLGSMFAGIAFAWGRLGNVHAMAHPLGGFYDMPHGIANAVLLPTVLEYNALADKGKYQRIYRFFQKENSHDFDPLMLVDEIRKLSRELDIPPNLSELGVDKESVPKMALDAMKSGNIAVNPRQTSLQDITDLYLRAL